MVSATVAVMVAVWPAVSEEGLMVTVVDVVSPALIAVPLTETCWVLPATFRVLSVTVIPALRVPAVCGVKFTATLQAAPARSDMDEVQGLVSAELLEKSAV